MLFTVTITSKYITKKEKDQYEKLGFVFQESQIYGFPAYRSITESITIKG